ncbi:hypothetical protein [Erwinia phyllosphaerae]|uniref:hypothetical protein n=1 Tax=Erwinia phyllosphaerae TaxID=2853256 RepID=UPI001FF02A55|nr:hypothetical protein [Erwinia phyllosphaerae]MBV4365896.1 hypothetical protein [Erwinia phyllosphaerae]
MSELKAGGLALVIRSSKQELIGRCVTLIELLSPGPFIYQGKRHIFKANGVGWLCDLEEYLVIFRPSQLMPIDGEDFSHEGERQKELTHG